MSRVKLSPTSRSVCPGRTAVPTGHARKGAPEGSEPGDGDEVVVAARPARAGGSVRRLVVVAVLVVAGIGLAYLRSGSPVIVSQAVVTGILIGGVYGLVAMGLTLIFGVLDIVNFAHGSFLALVVTAVSSSGVQVQAVGSPR